MVSSLPPNAPSSGPYSNTWQASSLLTRPARKPSCLYRTRSCVPSVVNPCFSNMSCLRLPVVLPRVGLIPAIPWIGQWTFCHLSLVGIPKLQFETITQWRLCAHEEPFSCTIILLNQPTVPAIDFLSYLWGSNSQARRCGIGCAA